MQRKSERARRHWRKHTGEVVFQAWFQFYVDAYESTAVEEASSPVEDTSTDYTDIISMFRMVMCRQQILGAQVLSAWREFVSFSKSDKEQEMRRNMMWKKVNSWLDQYKSSDQP